MGHYASEMGFGPTNKEIKQRNKQRRLRNKINQIEIGKFTVSEVLLILKMNGIPKGVFGNDLTDYELSLLDKAINRVTKL